LEFPKGSEHDAPLSALKTTSVSPFWWQAQWQGWVRRLACRPLQIARDTCSECLGATPLKGKFHYDLLTLGRIRFVAKVFLVLSDSNTGM